MLPLALALAGLVAAAPAEARKHKAATSRAAKAAVVATPADTRNYAVDFDASHDEANVLVLDLSTGGRVLIRLEPTWAPKAVERIETLARQGFYNGIVFHRVIDGFMAQTGDPTGTGQGGSPLPNLTAEFNAAPHLRGTVSMARTDDPDTANSQFFIMFYPRFALDHKYTNVGRVIAGMDFVDSVARGEPPEAPSKILQASMLSEHKGPPPPPPPPVIAPPPVVTPVTPPPVKKVVRKKAH